MMSLQNTFKKEVLTLFLFTYNLHGIKVDWKEPSPLPMTKIIRQNILSLFDVFYFIFVNRKVYQHTDSMISHDLLTWNIYDWWDRKF